MSCDILWRSSSFILTNDKGKNKEKKNLWYEFQATYTSTYTSFACKIHLNVALIYIIVLQGFSLPHRQLVMCMLGCSDLCASGAAPGQNPRWVLIRDGSGRSLRKGDKSYPHSLQEHVHVCLHHYSIISSPSP